MDLSKESDFVNKTILSTPEPKASSTTQKKQFRPSYRRMPSKPDSDDSLGILSLKSQDFDHDLDSYIAGKALLHVQRMLANESLQKASRLSSLPSRYLRSSDVSKNVTESCLNISCGSTISESDLLRNAGETSTPRTSICDEPRPSLGKSLADLSHKMRNRDMPLDSLAEEFQKLMQNENLVKEESNMFTPAEAAEAKLLADELSWKKENDVPCHASLCFTENLPSLTVSVGEFFKQKSESISDLDIATKSPKKQVPPVPLIDYKPSLVASVDNVPSGVFHDTQRNDIKNSLSISNIAQILQDPEQTPHRAMNYLLNKGKKATCHPNQEDYKSFHEDYAIENRPSSTKYHRDPKLSEITSINSHSYNKENIDFLNIQNSADTSIASRNSPVQDSTNTTTVCMKSPDYQAHSDRSTISLRSASSLSSLVNGKLPIEASKVEMVWNCVKPGKSLSQDVVIRNKSQSRLRLQCNVTGPSYKILKDRPDAEYVSIARYILQPGESKTISIMFAPIRVGAAVDSVNFIPADSNLHQQKPQKIGLYGFGGHSNVEIDNITKDVTGRFWLCLGQLDNRTPLSKAVRIRNTGTLPAFGYTTFENRDIYSTSTVKVSPQRFVLMPSEQKDVVVTYTPSKNDLTRLQSTPTDSPIEIGFLKLISGAEASRGRIRRLCEQAASKGLSVDKLCKSLSEHIPGEKMPSNLCLFKESLRNMNNLLRDFPVREIVLTLEQDPDATMMARFSDETLYFQTLSQATTLCINDTGKNFFKLEPSCIILSPPMKTEDMLLLTSEYDEAIHYNVKSESHHVILNPTSGILKPRDTVIIKVKYAGNTSKTIIDKVSVVMEKCVLDAVVKVLQVM